jgi:hypothetical protein
VKLLVITPTLGTSRYLNETVKSLSVVSNCSGWELCHVIVCPKLQVEQLSNRYPSSIIIIETGLGLYSAINDCLRQFAYSCDYWTYLNDDDTLRDGFTKALKSVDQNSITYGTVMLIDSSGCELGEVTRLVFGRWMKYALAGRRSPINQQGAVFPVKAVS